MLFEKITYQDDFPLNITIANIKEYPIHYHQDTEFVLVLKGEIALKNGYCTYLLHEGDIFTNSGHEVHSLTSTGSDNVVAVIQISTHYFSQYFPNLTKACYRTYTNKGHTKKHDALREKLLEILLQYSIKGFNYRSECTYMMVDVIKYIDKYFNLFAFEGDVVVNFESGNQITIDRISRIIGYIYEFHSDQITLNDLADMEHLSTFYLSHIIKNYTGMNFREFLCFARVEWSEIDLLETNKKISRIARDVGFSTTSYYEKYFRKWFGTDPQTYREQHMPLVMSDIRQGEMQGLNSNETISIIRKSLSSLSSQNPSKTHVNALKLELNVNTQSPSISTLDHYLDVHITLDDFKSLGYSIFGLIADLNPRRVTILTEPTDTLSDINRVKILMTSAGFEVGHNENTPATYTVSYGYDSIAYPIFLFNRVLKSKEQWIKLRLRDPATDSSIIKGFPAALTSDGIKKPVYYAYQALSAISGEIIYWGKQYCVIRSYHRGKPFYIIICCNFSEQIYNLCVKDSTVQNVKDVINDFKDEVDISMNMSIDQGMYTIMKYSLSRSNGIFSYLSTLNFPSGVHELQSLPGIVSTQPELDMYVEDVRATFNINFSIKGAGIQLAVITPKE
ncbi:MAG: AraC family transcriptional regulator [Firmicutes bacterium]|nr:AraC family transcriptional regulator [Bacillota bacterium]